MPILNPYITFAGNAEEAFNFYKSVFGRDIAFLQRFKDMPEAGKLTKREQDKVMHVALPIGKENFLMARDAPESMGDKITPGNNCSLAIMAEGKEEADKVFKGLSQGGKVTMPLSDSSWGAYFGMLTDKFGIHWLVNYTYPKSNQ